MGTGERQEWARRGPKFVAPVDHTRHVGRRPVIPGILSAMAKVMISLPDELLAQVDREAERRGTTRSAMVREFTAAALEQRDQQLAAAMRKLGGAVAGHGGNVVDHLKAGRPS